MREVLDDIERWQAAGKRVAVARVVGVEGSGPRDPGATMAVLVRSLARQVRLRRRTIWLAHSSLHDLVPSLHR